MNTLRKLIVVALLGVWSFPAVGAARPLTEAAAPAASPRAPHALPAPSEPQERQSPEAQDLQAREKQAPDLQDFRGGGVSIYIGSGAALVLVIILLIILI